MYALLVLVFEVSNDLSSDGLDTNGLSPDCTGAYGLSIGGLSANGLSIGGLSANGFILDGSCTNGLWSDDLSTFFCLIPDWLNSLFAFHFFLNSTSMYQLIPCSLTSVI